MLNANSHKSKQFLVALIKLFIVVGAFFFIYNKLTSIDKLEISTFVKILNENDMFLVKNVFYLVNLTIFNWFFEILKWKTLVSSVTSISFKSSMEQSLGALTASLLTPNRIGEYGAKVIYYQKPFRKKIMLLNLLGNMTQMGTTTIFGIVGLFFFTYNYSLKLNFPKLSGLIIILLLFIIIGTYFLKKSRFKIKGFSLAKIKEFIESISLKIKLKTFAFSVLRYLIFSFQFYYFLEIFNVSMDYPSAMMVITTMYFLSSIIPTIFIFDVVIKGSVAVYLFSIIGVNDLTIICIVTLMWLLNFVIPSVFGSYYVLNFNLPKVKDSI
jgi:hypothetical protein